MISFCGKTYAMNNSMPYQLEHIDDDKTKALDDSEWNNCKSRDRDYVNSLLDVSEEYSVKEQEPYEVQIPVGWEEAIQGWGRFAPLACLFQAQRNRRKVKADATDFHCLLCADLKDLKLSELPELDCAGASSETVLSCQSPEEPLKNSLPSSIEAPRKPPRNSSPCSSSTSEEDTFDLLTTEERNTKTDILGNKAMFGSEQFVPNRTLPQHFQPTVQCPFLKDRCAGKVPLMGTLMVLPPVRPPSPGHLRSVPVSKRREVTYPKAGVDNPIVVGGATETAAFDVTLDTDGQQEKAVPYRSSTVDEIYQGSLASKYGSGQHQYLLSIPVSRKGPLPFSPLEGMLPRASPILGRNFRQEIPFRHISGHRAHSNFKARSPKRAEPELPMLLGTRVAIPVSAHRLL